MGKPDTFRNKTIVISGATEGIGAAIVAEFATQGANIFLLGRDQRKLDRFHDYLSKNYPDSRVGVLSVDVSSYTQVRTAVKSIVRMVSRIDGLINNAGFIAPGYFESTAIETFEKANAVKYMGAVYLTKELIAHMNEGGFVSFTSGTTGLLPVYGYSSLVGPDFALVGFAQTLFQELASRKISVHVLVPPYTDTPGYRKFASKILPESGILFEQNQPVDPEHVAALFMKELSRRKFFMFVDFRSKLYYLLKNMFPGLFMWLMRRKIDAIRKNKTIQSEIKL